MVLISHICANEHLVMLKFFAFCTLFLLTLFVAGQSSDLISDVYNGVNGEEFTVKAIVTTPEFGNLENVQFFVQDSSGGLLANYGGGDCTTTQGDSVLITGTRSDRSGQVELSVSLLESINSNSLPDYQKINESDLQISSPVLGSRVVIDSVGILDDSNWPEEATDSTTVIAVQVGSASLEVRIENASFYDGSPVPCSDFNLAGILTRFGDEVQILPFFEGEIDPFLVPAITIDQDIIQFDTVTLGEESIKTFSLDASELTTSLELQVKSRDFKISLAQGSGYTDNLTLDPEEGTISSISIFIQFAPTSNDDQEGVLAISSCGVNQEILLKGSTRSVDAGIIFSSDSIIFEELSIDSTAVQILSVEALGLVEDLALKVSGDFELATSDTSSFTKELVIPTVDGTIDSTIVYVRFNPDSLGTLAGEIVAASSGFSQSIALLGTAVQTIEATVMLEVDSISFGELQLNTEVVKSFQVGATGLVENLSLETQGDFSLSTSATGTFDTTLQLSQVDGIINSTEIYVLFSPSSTGEIDEAITLQSSGIEEELHLFGIGIEPPTPEIVTDKSAFQFNETDIDSFSAPQVLMVSASGLSEEVQVVATGDFEISLDDSTAYQSSVSIALTNGAIENRKIFVRFSPSVSGTAEEILTLSSSGVSQSITLSGIGVDPSIPIITVDKNSISFGVTELGNEIQPAVLLIQASNLEADITVEVSGDFEIAEGIDGDFVRTLVFPVTNGKLDSTEFIVRVAPETSGVKSGSITIRSLDLVQSVDLLAEILQPDPVIVVSASEISFSDTEIGQVSSTSSFFIEGDFLTDDVLISAPEEFQVSLLEIGNFDASLVLSATDGTLPFTEIFVRFAPTTAGVKTENISIESTGVILEVNLDGTGFEKEEVVLTVLEKKVGIYPNPVTTSIALAGLVDQHASMRLTDQLGRILFNDQGEVASLLHDLNKQVPILSCGTYVLTLNSTLGLTTLKFVKQ